MEKRWPMLFGHLNCPMCGREKESLFHLMNTCVGTRTARMQIWESVAAFIGAATDLSQEEVNGAGLQWIQLPSQEGNQWFLGKIPKGVGKWIKKKSTKQFTMETIWNGIRGTILDGVGEIWKSRCDKNAEQRLTWAELSRLGKEWKWLSDWEDFEMEDEEVWMEEVANAEVDEFILLSDNEAVENV